MILPALTEATSPLFRPIKYSLFPPLGLATLAAYLREGDEVTIEDEHVEALDLDDAPDLVVVQVYITSASRAYRIAEEPFAGLRLVNVSGLCDLCVLRGLILVLFVANPSRRRRT